MVVSIVYNQYITMSMYRVVLYILIAASYSNVFSFLVERTAYNGGESNELEQYNHYRSLTKTFSDKYFSTVECTRHTDHGNFNI